MPTSASFKVAIFIQRPCQALFPRGTPQCPNTKHAMWGNYFRTFPRPSQSDQRSEIPQTMQMQNLMSGFGYGRSHPGGYAKSWNRHATKELAPGWKRAVPAIEHSPGVRRGAR